ncbi:MAG TPA: type II secretion system protein GspC [Gammaproteobacteria bacterium]
MIDVAKTLGALTEQSPEQWLRSANRVLPPVVVALLLLAIAYRLAELTWALIPHHAFDRPPPRIVQPSADDARSAANFSALEDSHLFGEARIEEAPAEPVNSELDAPETTLPLVLTGVTADENGKLSRAHIVSGRSEQKAYAVGDEIENAGGTTLHAVYRDRVIINRGGQLETLRFDETRTASTGLAGRAPPPPPAFTQPDNSASEDPSLRNVVTENSANLTQLFRMAPHMEGGQMVGFRLNPGRDRETFDALGLVPGDVVTEINGIRLDDPAKALQVFDALGESTQASVTILRNGVPNVMVIDTTQIQSLMNARR